MLDCIFCVSAGLSQGSIQMPAGLILQLKSISAPTGRIYHLWTGFTCNAACLKLSAVCISSLPWIPLCLLLFFFFFVLHHGKQMLQGSVSLLFLFFLGPKLMAGAFLPGGRAYECSVGYAVSERTCTYLGLILQRYSAWSCLVLFWQVKLANGREHCNCVFI